MEDTGGRRYESGWRLKEFLFHTTNLQYDGSYYRFTQLVYGTMNAIERITANKKPPSFVVSPSLKEKFIQIL